MKAVDEGKILKRLKAGDEAALGWFIERYTGYVSSIVYSLIGQALGQGDIEEVTADVFLALWAHAGELDPEQGLRPWLGTVARNRAKDWLRRRRETLPLDDALPVDYQDTPEEIAQQRDQAARLWAAVDELGEPDRTLFFRYYYQGDKLKDVARDLGLNGSAAKQRLLRGRQKLRQQLMEGGDAP